MGVYEQYAEWYWSRWVKPSKTQQFFIDYLNRVYGKDFKYPDFTNLFKAEMFNLVKYMNLTKLLCKT